METENKDWKPEVGKTAWLASAHNVMQLEIIEEGISAPPSFRCKGMGFDAFIFAYKLFPTPEAALASIKVYDLEGKEVVIPRARVDLPDRTQSLIDMANEHIEAIKRNNLAMIEVYKE